MKRITSDTFRWVSDSSGGWLQIKCSHPQRVLDGIQEGKLYDVEIKQHRERRSLDANGYFWVLADQLADKLTTKDNVVKKEDIYRRLIVDVPGASETVCVQEKAVDKLCRGWEHNGTGWMTERMPSKIPGCVNVILHYGSSVFDTAQMSRLISLVVEECKAQGIEVLTPDELARLEGME